MNGLAVRPQIEFRVERAAKTLDVEQGLLQQHKLRLDLHVETARDLEQTKQEMAERDLADRFFPDRFGHRADGRLEIFDARIARHPARFDMQFGDLAIVAVEKCQQVFGQVTLIGRGEGAHDAEIDADVTAVRAHEDVPRVHVGMEEIVAEYLREEDLDTAFAELLQLHAGGDQFVDLVDRNTIDAFLHHDVFARESQCISGT